MIKDEKKFILIGGLIVVAGLLMVYGAYKFSIFFHKKFSPNERFYKEKADITINKKKVSVELADTPEKRYKGLSGRKNLCHDCGMLFVFEDKGKRNFVMRDMNFNLDIIWIAGDKIIQVDKNLPRESENPQRSYSSEFPVDSVLEVNAGFCEENNIKVGDEVLF